MGAVAKPEVLVVFPSVAAVRELISLLKMFPGDDCKTAVGKKTNGAES